MHGGRVQGKYPESLLEGTALDVGRGRIIPEFSWEVCFAVLDCGWDARFVVHKCDRSLICRLDLSVRSLFVVGVG